MRIRPVTLKEAKDYINEFHRHHKAPVGWKFGTSLRDELNRILGVVVVGRPVARCFDDGLTLEVTRLCTDGTMNACSKLYGVARRVTFELGYNKIITYTLTEEDGVSLRAAGWILEERIAGRSWTCPSRPRTDKHPTTDKFRWASYNPKGKLKTI